MAEFRRFRRIGHKEGSTPLAFDEAKVGDYVELNLGRIMVVARVRPPVVDSKGHEVKLNLVALVLALSDVSLLDRGL